MKPLVIFGCGDFGQVATHYFAEDSPYRVVAFSVDRSSIAERKILGVDVVPFEEIDQHFPPSQCEMFVAVGYSRINRARREVAGRCKEKGYRLASYLSSRAMTCGPIDFGENTFVFESNTIQPYVKVGRNVILWSGNHIGHHSVIEDDCIVAGHAIIASHVRLGRGTFVGINATINNGITVGAENIIGAGALITGRTRDNEVYRGNRIHPADVASDKLWS